MTEEQFIFAAIGFGGNLLLAVARIPQLLRVYERQSAKDLSLTMLVCVQQVAAD